MNATPDLPVQSPFRPSPGLKSGRLQTSMASSHFRMPSVLPMEDVAEEHIITTPEGVRLQGFLSAGSGTERPLAVLFHGWEGTVRSAYIRRTGHVLFSAGFDVFRLHYRDHGDTQHLNRGPFRSDGIQEIYDAVAAAAGWQPDRPTCLAGFSLGGNFALRVARLAGDRPIDNLVGVIAVSPLLDPDVTTRMVDSRTWLRHYFLKKWFRSLRRKQAAWPEDYPIDDVFDMNTCMAVTERLVQRFLPYATVQDYFDTYTLKKDALHAVTVPTRIITAVDDPVIPVDGFADLDLPESVSLTITRYGGHCGFIRNWRMETWIAEEITRSFQHWISRRRS